MEIEINTFVDQPNSEFTTAVSFTHDCADDMTIASLKDFILAYARQQLPALREHYKSTDDLGDLCDRTDKDKKYPDDLLVKDAVAQNSATMFTSNPVTTMMFPGRPTKMLFLQWCEKKPEPKRELSPKDNSDDEAKARPAKKIKKDESSDSSDQASHSSDAQRSRVTP